MSAMVVVRMGRSRCFMSLEELNENIGTVTCHEFNRQRAKSGAVA